MSEFHVLLRQYKCKKCGWTAGAADGEKPYCIPCANIYLASMFGMERVNT